MNNNRNRNNSVNKVTLGMTTVGIATTGILTPATRKNVSMVIRVACLVGKQH
jgi:hypothetical protein